MGHYHTSHSAQMRRRRADIIRRMSDSGVPTKAIAERMNLSRRRVQQIVSTGAEPGRPCIMPDRSAEDLAHYGKLRRYLGAATARQMMGVDR